MGPELVRKAYNFSHAFQKRTKTNYICSLCLRETDINDIKQKGILPTRLTSIYMYIGTACALKYHTFHGLCYRLQIMISIIL